MDQLCIAAAQAGHATMIDCHTLEVTQVPVPTDIDKEVARLKLRAMRVDIDELTPEQVKYLASWQEGT